VLYLIESSALQLTNMPLFRPSFYSSTRDKKLSQREEALNDASTLLSEIPIDPEEDTILTTPAWSIHEKIKAKEWTSLQVVAAFSRRLITTQKESNCLTESTSPYYKRD
jgi:hypothetical protein